MPGEVRRLGVNRNEPQEGAGDYFMKPFAEKFYKSQAWKETRKAYAASVGYLCEECLRRGVYRPGEIVHHIRELTPENISDPAVTLSWANLELLCRDCHAKRHQSEKRYRFGENGEIPPW